MDIKRILWPTDLSGNAEKALPCVTSLSEKFEAEVHILYVIEELALHESWYGEFDQGHIDKIHAWERTKAFERLDQICEEHLQGCPFYYKEVAIGDPAEEILKLIDKQEIDIVVMATRGRQDRFAFGGVAEKVVKHSPVPVVSIPVNGSEP
ncbi:MAG: universal stress protein [Deltaproteobacteria bacterium]|nr:universal stress protein [Deltaproteobacteria bacterium]